MLRSDRTDYRGSAEYTVSFNHSGSDYHVRITDTFRDSHIMSRLVDCGCIGSVYFSRHPAWLPDCDQFNGNRGYDEVSSFVSFKEKINPMSPTNFKGESLLIALVLSEPLKSLFSDLSESL